MMYLLTWGSKRALSAKLLYWSAGTCLATQGKEISQPQRAFPTSSTPASMSFPVHMTIMQKGDPAGSGLDQRQNEELRALMATTGHNSRLRKGQASPVRWGGSKARKTSHREIPAARGSVSHSQPG